MVLILRYVLDQEVTVNILEMLILMAYGVFLVLMVGLYVRYRVIPKVEPMVGGMVGRSIGRFMQNLAEEAEKEGTEGGGGAPGMINLGGFKIDIGTVKELMALAPQLLQLAKMFGVGSFGGGGGGGKIGL